MSLVTLVTPAFNQGEFLAQTMESVLAQTHRAIDYLVIDDGSTDDTADVLARYASRVQSIRQANMGQAATLNRGWEAATGPYLAYLSSDDLLFPEAIARAVDVLDRDPSIVCVFPDANLIGPTGRVLRRNICRPFDHAALLVRQECWIGPGAVFRTDAYRAVGGWRSDLRFAPDREFWLRLGLRGQFRFIPDVLADYRLHGRSISFGCVSEEQAREYLRVLDGFFARDLPPGLAAVQKEARGYAHYVIAQLMMREGRIGACARHWRAARRLAPRTGSLRHAGGLLRAAVGKLRRSAQIGVLRVALRE